MDKTITEQDIAAALGWAAAARDDQECERASLLIARDAKFCEEMAGYLNKYVGMIRL
jgi:hypothetical protein